MGRLPRARARARRRGELREPQASNDLHRALRRGRAGARQGAARRPTASSTARSARSTRRAGRASRRCSRAKPARRSSTTSSTCSRSTASRSSTCRSPSGARGCEKLLDRRNRTVRLSETFDDGEALLARGRGAGPRGHHGQARSTRATSRASARRDWLKVKTHGEQEFVIAGYTRGQGRRERSFGALVLGVRRRRRPATGSATSAPGFDEDEIERLLGKLAPARAQGLAVRRRCRRCRGSARATSSGSSRSSSPRSSSPSGRTTAACARPSTSGCARTRPRERRCGRERRRFRTRSARASACSSSRTSTSRSGRRRGSRRATCSPTTATSRRCSCRTCATGRSR